MGACTSRAGAPATSVLLDADARHVHPFAVLLTLPLCSSPDAQCVLLISACARQRAVGVLGACSYVVQQHTPLPQQRFSQTTRACDLHMYAKNTLCCCHDSRTKVPLSWRRSATCCSCTQALCTMPDVRVRARPALRRSIVMLTWCVRARSLMQCCTVVPTSCPTNTVPCRQQSTARQHRPP